MGLVTAKEVAKAINADKYGVLGTFSGWLLMKMLKISTLNKVYDRNKHLKDVAFLNGILDDLQIKFEIPEEDLKRLPKEGAYITISNHPLGGIDGVLLLKLMLEREPNFKIIANFLLHRIEPLKKYIMPVNPFENHKDVKSSVVGIKETLRHLSDGKPLGNVPGRRSFDLQRWTINGRQTMGRRRDKSNQKSSSTCCPNLFPCQKQSIFLFTVKNRRHIAHGKITVRSI